MTFRIRCGRQGTRTLTTVRYLVFETSAIPLCSNLPVYKYTQFSTQSQALPLHLSTILVILFYTKNTSMEASIVFLSNLPRVGKIPTILLLHRVGDTLDITNRMISFRFGVADNIHLDSLVILRMFHVYKIVHGPFYFLVTDLEGFQQIESFK